MDLDDRAYVTTKEEAFSTPKIFNQDSTYTGLGDNSLREAEKLLIEYYEGAGRPDLADCVKGGKLYTRLEMIGNYDPMYVKWGFREIFGEDIPADFNPPRQDVEWRVYMMRRYEGHEGLKKVMQEYGWSMERAEREAEEWKIRNEKSSKKFREEYAKEREKMREEFRKEYEEKKKSELTGYSVDKE
uniref:Uncharacterized protein n=1 Tax=Kwoniella bestiolae CBS 10118 TaxID=1296100 RepID=A0A1B9GEZ2_9TREE|nr:hypothetical protein I302_01116 [Kwoniella bestiolae CBS 10118]OCF29607.1 hypothetical protein I302_01116 [Kwoniella bestiolae CBS 10118]